MDARSTALKSNTQPKLKGLRITNMSIVGLLLTLVFSSTISCVQRPCREPRSPELDQTKRPGESPSLAAATPTTEDLSHLPARVRIFKADGSRQCDRKPGMSVEVMQRELAGISVYNQEKKPDGLARIQLCGSPSGMINVYEIDRQALKQAEERGFRRLEE